MPRTTTQKFNTVIQKNTYYFFNAKFEQQYEGYISSLKELLLLLKNRIDNEGLKKEIFEDLLKNRKNGLRAILALTGFSNEYLKRLITIIRIVDDSELNQLVYKEKWHQPTPKVREWSDITIQKLIQKNEYFRKGVVNLFFEGASISFLTETIPLFELRKLSLSKLKFEIPEMLDTLVRYKEKGSYSGKKANNPEIVISEILTQSDITFETGDLTDLIHNAPNSKRTMDFIIPNKENPKLIIECSFLATTSSGQGDKSKTEISINELIKAHYPKAQFIGFVDGIGWYVRQGDLKRMVSAYEDVYTFHPEELQRFEQLLSQILK